MFAYPLTSFCTHLEASNCHIGKNDKQTEKTLIFYWEFSGKRLRCFGFFAIWQLEASRCVQNDLRGCANIFPSRITRMCKTKLLSLIFAEISHIRSFREGNRFPQNTHFRRAATAAEEFPVPARPHPITQGYHILFGSRPSLRHPYRGY